EAESAPHWHGDAYRVLVDEPGVPIERRELDGRIRHRELDGNPVSPARERLDVARQSVELNAHDVGIRHQPTREHDVGRACGANDDPPTSIVRQRLERDLVDDLSVLAIAHHALLRRWSDGGEPVHRRKARLNALISEYPNR